MNYKHIDYKNNENAKGITCGHISGSESLQTLSYKLFTNLLTAEKFRVPLRRPTIYRRPLAVILKITNNAFIKRQIIKT